MERYQKQHFVIKSMLSSKIWTCKRNDTRRRHQCPNLHFTLNDATTTTIGINRNQYLRSVTFARCQGILAHTALTDNSQYQCSDSFGLQAVKLPQRKRVRLLKYKPQRHRRDNLRKEQETSTPRHESLQPNPTVSQLMAKGIHLEADSTTQEFKLFHGRGGLYIGKAVLKNNVFVLDFVPDLGTADSDRIVTFTSWTHPPDLDPDFSPEGFWYSHTIPEAEQTRALATIQHSAAPETTSAAAETTSAAVETSATPTTLTTPVTSSSTTLPHIDNTSPTPAQQLSPTPREVHRSANFYSNSDLYRRSPGHRASEDIWHARWDIQILGLVTVVHGTDTPKEPATVQQALGGEHREKCREAMDKELKALQERNTWKVVPIGVARNKTILTGKWVFRVKTKADGTIDKFKARWVVRGFDQEHGRDFTETFAPVSRHTSLRILLAIVAMKKKNLRQIDVANAFLYAPVDAEIFVELPHGSHGEPNQVCQLPKSLYGIKQAPRLWQQYLHARLTRIGFRQLPHDQGMYRLTKGDDYILVIVYVDDLLYIGSTDNGLLSPTERGGGGGGGRGKGKGVREEGGGWHDALL
ncbi:unnamed protein product [Closterium sp. NIES-54]